MTNNNNKVSNLLLLLVLVLTYLSSSTTQALPACSAVFPSPLSIHSATGSINFNFGSYVEQAPGKLLTTPAIVDSLLNYSCKTEDCIASGNTSALMTLGTFQAVGAGAGALTVVAGSLQVVSTITDFSTVQINSDARLQYLLPAGANIHVGTMTLANNASLVLSPGDYWIGTLTLGSNVSIESSDPTKVVRIHLNSPFTAYDSASINNAASSSAMLFTVRGTAQFNNASISHVSLYSTGNVLLKLGAKVYGSIAAPYIELQSLSIFGAEVGDAKYLESPFCDASPPDADGDGMRDRDDIDRDGDGINNDMEWISRTDAGDPQSRPLDVNKNGVPDFLDGNFRTYCDALSANSVQTINRSSDVKLDLNAQLLSTTSTILATPVFKYDALSSAKSCGSVHCSASGAAELPIPLPQFRFTNNFTAVSVGSFQDITAGAQGQVQYGAMTIGSQGTLRFASSAQEYRIRSLNAGLTSHIYFTPGTYWIEKLKLASMAKIHVDGSGTVRLFIKDVAQFDPFGKLNADNSVASSDAAKLSIFAYSDLLFNQNEVAAYIYSRDKVSTGPLSVMKGALTARRVEMGQGTTFSYQADAVPRINFGEACDLDHDRIYDTLDTDRDGDQVVNTADAFPLNPQEWLDTDLDGIGNNADTDDDNDGVMDVSDAFPLDPAESLDTDHDGIGNNADPDDDNDGVDDSADTFPVDATEYVDTDHDGMGNNADTDDDNDGVADSVDAFPLNASESRDFDHDGVGDNADSDDDGDGVPDLVDAFPLNAAESIDTDHDGVGNNTDADDDGDGVPDLSDAFPLNAAEFIDSDNDGVGNNADTDDDNDGVPDSSDAFPLNASESVDTDGDGVGNNTDTDDDGDGVADASDAFPLDHTEQLDTDGDGSGNNTDTDDDNDGILDVDDEFPLNALESTDSDGDGTGDNADTDDDNDGVLDTVDAFPRNAAESVDTDHDGIGNNADSDDDNDGVADASDAFPLNAAEFVDTDGDGVGNNADTDDDGDGVADINDSFPLNANESVDSDGDGSGNNADTDDDGDGVADVNDAFPLDANESIDSDGDGSGDNADTDDDNDGVLDTVDAFPRDASESVDSDHDGIGNNADNDDDNDGVADTSDAFPLNSAETTDTDGDGIGNNADADDDGDGIPDVSDAFPLSPDETVDTDGDGIGNNTDTDDDGDGVADTNDAFPLNASESADSDSDGVGDNADSDDDNDGALDTVDVFPLDAAESVDTDHDGIGNNADSDDDNDGALDSVDVFPLNAAESVDTDHDGIGNNADDDDDNDGALDTVDAFPLNAAESIDTDHDGVGNNADSDDDNDGVVDASDAFPLDATESVDTDGDGIGNNVDTDDDGDGIPDVSDAFPLDAGDAVDTDGDGIGNNTDTDDDGDGVADTNDAFPLNASESADSDSDGVGDNADSDDDNDGVADASDAFPLDATESIDTDGDGVGNNADTDDDGDGVADTNDAFPLNADESVDSDGDGSGDNADTDDDNDGVLDTVDAFPRNAAESVDTDHDGIGNNADTDDDNDSVADASDAFPLDAAESVDTDGDGIGNNTDTDDDGDGVADTSDAFPLNASETVDTDGDGIGNRADPDDDNDGVADLADAFPLNASETVDSDSDGVGDNADTDDDNDGVLDTVDAFPRNASESVDTDHDGIGNNADADDDGDNVPDAVDAFPLDAAELVDTDGDGIGNNADTDDDGDGVADVNDAFPLNAGESVDSDGDGSGDNADPDRDGDGYSNDEEIAAGSDPNSANSTPTVAAPSLAWAQQPLAQTEESVAHISGTVNHSQLNTVTMSAQNSAAPGSSYTVTRSGNGWSASIPLVLGSNTLTVSATDANNHVTTLTASTTRVQADTSGLVQLLVDSPAASATVDIDHLVVNGRLVVDQPAQSTAVTVKGNAVSLTPTSQNTVFTFASSPITLQQGSNIIPVVATVVINGTSVVRNTTLVITYTPPQTQTPAPEIQLLEPAAGRDVSSRTFHLVGEATSYVGAATININGATVALDNNQTQAGTFQRDITIPNGADYVDVVAAITDGEGRTATASGRYQVDAVAPQWLLGGNLLPVTDAQPAQENAVIQYPYHLTGSIIDTNLSSASINGQSLALTPSGSGQFDFDVALPLVAGQLLEVRLDAQDFAGNRSSAVYRLRLISTATLDILVPLNGTELVNLGQPIRQQIAARIAGPAGQYSARAVTNGPNHSATTALAVTDSITSGDVELPPVAGDYTVNVELLDVANTVISQAPVTLHVRDAEQQAVAVERIEPVEDATGIEPNGFISLYFNRPIDPALLTIEVKQTVHGATYVDRRGTGDNPLAATGYELAQVNFDQAPIVINKSPLPGNKVVSLYPATELAYGAQVYVTVTYNGEDLLRSRFDTRPLPTFVEGGVVDQFGQPADGVTVSLPALGRSTTTNTSGAFNFGYGDRADQTLPAGEYQLVLNPDMANPAYGTLTRWVTIVAGQVNRGSIIYLPQLNLGDHFSPLQAGQTVPLVKGALTLDMTQASVIFPDGKPSGLAMGLFLPMGTQGITTDSAFAPLWTYAVQPAGIRVQGHLKLSLRAPELESVGLGYLPQNGQYVLIVGLDRNTESLQPIGVGKLQDGVISSEGSLTATTLDQFGIVTVPVDLMPQLQAYAEGSLDLRALATLVQSRVRQLEQESAQRTQTISSE